MKVAAILAVRNERPYLWNCLTHLIENGVDYCLIDNDSEDGVRELLNRDPFKQHLIEYIFYPYKGYFDWRGLMTVREKAAARSGADWVLFVSADEIMHSYKENETLVDAIERVAKSGADVIDFDEFVFLPVEIEYVSDLKGFQPLRHYYFFQPYQPRLMRARKRELNVSHIDAGGHTFSGGPISLADEPFVMRHYMFRNQEHALRKYKERVFSEAEIARGWHRNRYNIETQRFIFPSAARLLRLPRKDARMLEKSTPYERHYWEWPEPTR
ncbi:MAG: glycosyltransferase family 2 protein [Parvularculaceae bacterium]